MGNVFKLIRNWLSNQPDDDAKNVTHLDQSSCISSDPPVYSWLVRLLSLKLIRMGDRTQTKESTEMQPYHSI
jgi:hypothetical protein